MKVNLNIVDKNFLKPFEISDFKSVKSFLNVLNTHLDSLEKNSYYCIFFNYINQYNKTIKAKLGYIYKDNEDLDSIIVISDENYLEYYINKFDIKNIELDCIKKRGKCTKSNIIIERESISMADDINLKISKKFSPETNLYKIFDDFRNIKYYNIIEIKYTKLNGNIEHRIVINDKNNIINDIALSEFIIDNNIDTSKEIHIELYVYYKQPKFLNMNLSELFCTSPYLEQYKFINAICEENLETIILVENGKLAIEDITFKEFLESHRVTKTDLIKKDNFENKNRIIKKQNFEYGSPKYYISDKYVLDTEEYIIIIDEDIFDDETIEYVNRIIEKYIQEKNEILNYMLDIDLRDFYSSRYNYSDEYIKNNIGRPQINIFSRKDDAHPNWKFKYAGSIEFLEHHLDDHIISVDFIDDLNLSKDIQIDG